MARQGIGRAGGGALASYDCGSFHACEDLSFDLAGLADEWPLLLGVSRAFEPRSRLRRSGSRF
jgi:hypothetical protein